MRVALPCSQFGIRIWISDSESFGERDDPSKIWNLNYIAIRHKNYQNMMKYCPRAHTWRAVTSGSPSAEILGGGRTDDLVELLIGDSIFRGPVWIQDRSESELACESSHGLQGNRWLPRRSSKLQARWGCHSLRRQISALLGTYMQWVSQFCIVLVWDSLGLCFDRFAYAIFA